MTEHTDIEVKPEPSKVKAERRFVDWEGIEREYRSGVKTLRLIADGYGVTHGAVNKRAKAEGWPRDLQAKIMSRAEQKVSKALVSNGSNSVSTDTNAAKVTENEIIEANAQAIAVVDLTNRKDVKLAIDIARSQLEELACMGDPEFKPTLEWLGQCMNRGRTDKAYEAYQYIISLAGRVKMAKEIAASVGVYIPLQRKMLKLDVDLDKSISSFDALLIKVNAQTA